MRLTAKDNSPEARAKRLLQRRRKAILDKLTKLDQMSVKRGCTHHEAAVAAHKMAELRERLGELNRAPELASSSSKPRPEEALMSWEAKSRARGYAPGGYKPQHVHRRPNVYRSGRRKKPSVTLATRA